MKLHVNAVFAPKRLRGLLFSFLVLLLFCWQASSVAASVTPSSTPWKNNSTTPYFIKDGDKFRVTSREALDLYERLPTATYTVGISQASGEYFLQRIDPFEVAGKIYGDTESQTDRILSTFLDRQGSTGVLLSGEKGSGKTFLAKWISIQAAARHDIPTVVINQPLAGERFNAFIQSIHQPVVFLFDEFEKIYADREAKRQEMEYESENYGGGRHLSGGSYNQDSMLTLLDGTYPSKMLFLLTTNDKFRVSNHMRNRPGRIYYVIDFTGLPQSFIKDYCNDNLNDKSMIPQVVSVSSVFEAFSFDMLQSMVEEMNRYEETAVQVLSYLNVRPEFTGGARYDVKLIVDGKQISRRNMYSNDRWYGNPLASAISMHFEMPRPPRSKVVQNGGVSQDSVIDVDGPSPVPSESPDDSSGSSDDYDDYYDYDSLQMEIEFTSSEIDKMDTGTGTFEYWNKEHNARLILQKRLQGDAGGGHAVGSNGSFVKNLARLSANYQ